MAGTYKGSIEHYVDSSLAATGSIQALFKATFDLLSNAGDIGVQRLAYSTGSVPSGTPVNGAGTGYYDAAAPFGNNAWACFRFLSATKGAFDVLIQYTGTATFGTLPGAPGRVGGTTNAAFGFSAACKSDGTTAWGGTTNNNGADTKGSIVWVSGSTKMAVYPRSNAIGGSFVTNKQDMVYVAVGVSNSPVKFNILIDNSTLYFTYDEGSSVLTSTYDFTYFGPYTAMSGTTPTASYVCIGGRGMSAGSNTTAGTTFGTTAGTTVAADGGISHPYYGDVKIGIFDRLTSLFATTSAQQQPSMANESPQYTAMPIVVGMSETSASYGMCGMIHEFIQEVYNVNIHDTNSTKTKAVLGGAYTFASVKHLVPWHSGTTPGTGRTRNGVQFASALWLRLLHARKQIT